MPSNADLVTTIAAAAEAAGADVPTTTGKTNAELTEVLKLLKIDSVTVLAKADGLKYFVEEGKSLTSKRGIRGPHDDVTEGDIPGTGALDALVDGGYLYKGEKSKPEVEAAAKAKAAKAKAKKLAKQQ